MCRLLGFSPSGFYAQRKRPQWKPGKADEDLSVRIRSIHERSRGTYGAPRIQAELAAAGQNVSRKRVARLMKLLGVEGISRRRQFSTTIRDRVGRQAPDLVERKFQAAARDQLWVADITYIPTATGFLYLAVVVDAWSRRVVGWSMATHLRTELVLEALDMAIAQRRPSGVIHHSDQGCQYTSIAFGQWCREADVRPSMGSVGIVSTTPCARASLPRWNANCWPVVDSARRGGPPGGFRLLGRLVQLSPSPLSPRLSQPG
jgi:transposase InsO family protein